MICRFHRIWFLFVIALLFHGCSENLPGGPDIELEDVLRVRLTTDLDRYAQENTYREEYEVPDNMSWLEFNQSISWKVYFRVRLENVFDEPVVGTEYVDATIKVWDKNDTTKVRTLVVLDTLSTDTIIVEPGEIYTVFSGDRFVWDQTDDWGEPFAPGKRFLRYSVQERITYDKHNDVYYRHCDTLGSFWADTVIAFNEPIHIQAQATVQIFREYGGDYWKSEVIEFPIVFISHAGWTPVNKPCKEGYVIQDPP